MYLQFLTNNNIFLSSLSFTNTTNQKYFKFNNLEGLAVLHFSEVEFVAYSSYIFEKFRNVKNRNYYFFIRTVVVIWQCMLLFLLSTFYSNFLNCWLMNIFGQMFFALSYKAFTIPPLMRGRDTIELQWSVFDRMMSSGFTNYWKDSHDSRKTLSQCTKFLRWSKCQTSWHNY